MCQLEEDTEAKAQLGLTRDMHAFVVAAAVARLQLDVQAPGDSTLMIQPPVQDGLGRAALVRRWAGTCAAAVAAWTRTAAKVLGCPAPKTPLQMHYTYASRLMWPNGNDAWRWDKRERAAPADVEQVGGAGLRGRGALADAAADTPVHHLASPLHHPHPCTVLTLAPLHHGHLRAAAYNPTAAAIQRGRMADAVTGGTHWPQHDTGRVRDAGAAGADDECRNRGAGRGEVEAGAGQRRQQRRARRLSSSRHAPPCAAPSCSDTF